MLGKFEVGCAWPLVTFQQGGMFYVLKPNGATYPVHADRFAKANKIAIRMAAAIYKQSI